MTISGISQVLAFSFLSSILITQVSPQELTFAKVETLQDAIRYLIKFGYLKDIKEVAGLLTSGVITDTLLDTNTYSDPLRVALSTFQTYTGLEVTGSFDKSTKKKMNTPRCGNKDILHVPDITDLVRSRRFLASGRSWHKLKLTYGISDFSQTGFDPVITLREIDKAFKVWSKHTNLEFTRAANGENIDIELRFARAWHGDLEAFDGRGIELAHAFGPGRGMGGDIHFDDDEEWSSESYSGQNFYQVVVHEIGHALGLRHSEVQLSVMYAFAISYNPDFRLHEDDILGIQSIYGKKGSPPPNTFSGFSFLPNFLPEPELSPGVVSFAHNASKPDICSDTRLDAITDLENGRVYAFRGAYAFRLEPEKGGIISTDEIRLVFYGLPGNIDAATTFKGKTYFFKGGLYWCFDNRKIDGIYPRKISQDFPGIPDNLDAAFAWSGDKDSLFFFKGDKFWSFNPESKPQVPPNYPLPISQWLGIPPDNIDAAFTSPTGPTYFFKGDNFWLFDDENFLVAEADPPYPHSARKMWFRCTPYRPKVNELKQGWLGKAFRKIKNHFEYKFDVIKGIFG